MKKLILLLLCGFNVTIWLRSEGSIGRTQPKIDHLKQTYIEAIEKMAEDKNAWCAGLAESDRQAWKPYPTRV